MNASARVGKPMLKRLKSNRPAAISATNANRTTAFAAADSIWATTYSTIDSGAMNMLLKLCDQTFHNAPSDMEYWVTRMISHIKVPRYRYWAIVGFMTVDKNFVTNPKTITVIKDQNGR